MLNSVLLNYYTVGVRLVLPLLGFILVFINGLRLILIKKPKFITCLKLSTGEEYTVKNAENLIGSSKKSDIRIPQTELNHAVLRYTQKGYTIKPFKSCKTYVNDKIIRTNYLLNSNDVVCLNDVSFRVFYKRNPDKKDIKLLNGKSNVGAYVLLTLYRVLMFVSFILAFPERFLTFLGCFLALTLTGTVYFVIKRFKNILFEILLLYLTDIGICVAARVGDTALVKQAVCAVIGEVGFVLLTLLLKSPKFINGFKIPAAIIGLGFFALNIVLGVTKNGSQNWVNIGGFSFQPSEFVKIVLVFISAASLDKIVDKNNIWFFAVFGALSIGILAYLRDFGTAAVYFAAFLTVIFLRLCDVKIISAITVFSAAAMFAAIKFLPYVAKRFESYTHAWEYAATGGYQQTRTMVAIGSGGLLGLGTGNGNFINITASDTDMVFGLISEEWGFITALTVLVTFAVFTFIAARCFTGTTSVYYGITAAAASVIFMCQAALNVFGSVDILPFTGVTLPFVSNGGSSMITSFMLAAFIKAALDNRVYRKDISGEEVVM